MDKHRHGAQCECKCTTVRLAFLSLIEIFKAHFGKFPNSIAMKWIETSNDTEVETDFYSEREAFFEFMLPMLGLFFLLTFIFYFLHGYSTPGAFFPLFVLLKLLLEKLGKIKSALSPKSTQKFENCRNSAIPIVKTPALR